MELIVPTDVQPDRVDRWLARRLPDVSRSEIQKWISQHRIRVNSLPTKASYQVEPGDQIDIEPAPHPAAQPLVAQPISLDVVYEDDHVIVIHKPAGMVVHPAPGHPDGTLVNAIMYHFPEIEGISGEKRPGIVHRLDKDTSGLLVVAKNARALRHLQQQFKHRTVHKEYIALLEGRLDPPDGRITGNIGRHPEDRKRQAVLPVDRYPRAREATTDYKTAAVYTAPTMASSARGNFTLVYAYPRTGRTHQIRVHFAWLGHPLVGDRVYGYRKQRLEVDRLFLHAHRLRFKLPGAQTEIEFVAPLPVELQMVLDLMDSHEI